MSKKPDPNAIFDVPAISPIGQAITIPLPRIVFNNSFKNLQSRSTSVCAGMLFTGVEFAIKCVLDTILSGDSEKYQKVKKPAAPKKGPGAKKKKSNKDEDYNDDDDEGGDESEEGSDDEGTDKAEDKDSENQKKFASAETREDISCERLAMQYKNFEGRDLSNKIMSEFPSKVPRIYVTLEFLPINAEEENFYAFSNCAGILLTFCFLDRNLDLLKIFNRHFDQNARSAVRKSKFKSKGRDLSEKSRLEKIVSSSGFLEMMEAITGVAKSESILDLNRTNALLAITRVQRYDPAYTQIGATEFLLKETIPGTIFVVQTDKIGTLIEYRFPWKPMSRAEKILYSDNLPEYERRAIESAKSLGYDPTTLASENESATEIITIRDPFNSLSDQTEKLRADIVKERVRIQKFVDGVGTRRDVSQKYIDQLKEFMETNMERLTDVYDIHNPELPFTVKNMLKYCENLELEGRQLHLSIPIHYSDDPDKLCAFADWIVNIEMMGEGLVLPDAFLPQFLNTIVSSFSVYFLDVKQRLALNEVYIGRGSSGKSYFSYVFSKGLLIEGTEIQIGQESDAIAKRGLNLFRVIQFADDASSHMANGKEGSIAEQNSLLSGSIAYSFLQTYVDKNGIEKKKPSAFQIESTIVRVLCANEGFGSNTNQRKPPTESELAYYSRYTLHNIGDVAHQSRMRLADKTLRTEITKDMDMKRKTSEYIKFMQAMCQHFMIYRSLGLIPDIPSELTISIVGFINKRFPSDMMTSRDTASMQTRIKILHFLFSAHYVCFYEMRNQPPKNMFRVETFIRISQCYFERLSIIIYVLAGAIYRHTDQEKRDAVLKYLELKNIFSGVDIKKKHYSKKLKEGIAPDSSKRHEYVDSLVSTIKGLMPYNEKRAYISHNTSIGNTKNGDAGFKDVMAGKIVDADKCNSSIFRVPNEMENIDIKRCLDQKRISFDNCETQDGQYLNPNYIFIPGRNIAEMTSPYNRSVDSFEVGSAKIGEKAFGDILKELSSKMAEVPYLPLIPMHPKSSSELHKPSNNVILREEENFRPIRSLLNNEAALFSMFFNKELMEKGLFARLPIVLPHKNGWCILVAFLLQDPKEFVKSHIRSVFYNSTPKFETLLDIPGEIPIVRERFSVHPEKGVSFKAPQKSAINKSTARVLRTNFAAHIPEEYQEDTEYLNSDIERECALNYLTSNFPKLDPADVEKIFDRFSNAAIEERTDLFRPAANGGEILSYPDMLFSRDEEKDADPILEKEPEIPDDLLNYVDETHLSNRPKGLFSEAFSKGKAITPVNTSGAKKRKGKGIAVDKNPKRHQSFSEFELPSEQSLGPFYDHDSIEDPTAGDTSMAAQQRGINKAIVYLDQLMSRTNEGTLE
jgi:hypothetical protein